MKKSERINDMMIYLNNKETFNLKDIMEKYSISKNTALRDIRSLEEIGMPIYSFSGRNGRYKILKNKLFSPVLFNVNEIHALYFTILALKGCKKTPFHLDIEKLKEKFKSCLPQKQIEEINKMETILNFEVSKHQKESPLLKKILENSIEEKVCKILYKEEKKDKYYFVQFFKISSAYEQWLASGYDFEDREIKNFQCDKIIHLAEDDKFEPISFEKFVNLNSDIYKIHDCNIINFELEI